MRPCGQGRPAGIRHAGRQARAPIEKLPGSNDHSRRRRRYRQEAFLKAWRFASSYDGRARFSTWLTRIAWRCLLDEARKSRSPDPDQASVHSTDGEHIALVADMLARLTEPERAALILCDGHGWSHSEAAELLGMPLGSLKTVVARAKSKCREMWSSQYVDA